MKFLAVAAFSVVFLLSSVSCSSRKSMCMKDNTFRTHNYKKKKSGSGTAASYKSKSVRKDYVIRNGVAR